MFEKLVKKNTFQVCLFFSRGTCKLLNPLNGSRQDRSLSENADCEAGDLGSILA